MSYEQLDTGTLCMESKSKGCLDTTRSNGCEMVDVATATVGLWRRKIESGWPKSERYVRRGKSRQALWGNVVCGCGVRLMTREGKKIKRERESNLQIRIITYFV